MFIKESSKSEILAGQLKFNSFNLNNHLLKAEQIEQSDVFTQTSKQVRAEATKMFRWKQKLKKQIDKTNFKSFNLSPKSMTGITYQFTTLLPLGYDQKRNAKVCPAWNSCLRSLNTRIFQPYMTQQSNT